MGRKSLNALPEKVKKPLEIMENLHKCLEAFLSSDMDIKMFKDDDLKTVKDLRKNAAELKDDLDTFRGDVEKRSHSISSGTSRFAAKEIVSKFLEREE